MGLRGKLLLRILLPVALLVAALWGMERVRIHSDALERATARLETSASTAAEVFELRAEQIETALTAVLAHDSVVEYLQLMSAARRTEAERERASLENSAKKLFGSVAHLRSIELFDNSGRRFLAIHDRTTSRAAIDVGSEDWFVVARTGARETNCVGSGLIRVTRSEQVPGTPNRVVAAMTIDVAALGEGVFPFAKNESDGVAASLYCRHATLLFGPGSGQVGDEPIVVEVPQEFCEGRLVVEQSRALALAALERTETRSLGVVLVAIATLLMTVWLGLRRTVLKPASELLEVVRSFEQGAPLPPERKSSANNDELASLDLALRGAIQCERRSTARLQTLNQSLEGRVVERTKELLAARDEALAASRAKSDFLANMSHEIRTPMNGVIGMTDLLLGTRLTDEQHDYARIVRSSAESLLEIINDVLDFSKVEAGQMDLEEIEFDPVGTVEDVVDLLGTTATAKGLELRQSLSPDLPRQLVGDPGRLRQVLTNLIGNAIKFTREGHVEVAALVADETDEEVVLLFEVLDTGIGLPANARECIFDAFMQADGSTTRKYGGTGLGLSICRHLVTLMGGEIDVSSQVGNGARFWFTVSLERVGAAPDATDAGPSAVSVEAVRAPLPTAAASTDDDANEGDDDRRLLLAEDNPVNQRVALHLLQRMGFAVDVVSTGVEALEKQTDRHYAAVLMDCQMPEMDGYTATKAIRSGRHGASDVPIIAMTANAMVGDRERCLDAGMDDYLSKPIDTDVLEEKLTHWVQRRSRAG